MANDRPSDPRETNWGRKPHSANGDDLGSRIRAGEAKVKFGVCRLRLCGGESPVCTFEEESAAGANQGDQLTRAGTSARPYRDFPKKFNGTTSPQARHLRRRWGRYRSGRKGPAVAESDNRTFLKIINSALFVKHQEAV